jgi:hypothetical protein
MAAFLAERSGQRWFRDLASGRLSSGLSPFSVEPADEAQAVRILDGDRSLVLFAGRQIVTAERIEILGLTLDPDMADGEPAETVVDRVREAGGIAVVNWAPGKWFFSRGRVVRRLIDGAAPGELALGDSSLRPLGWPEPLLMRQGAARGLTILAGSDPLPFRGDESVMGTFGCRVDGTLDPARPVASVRAALRTPGIASERLGRRRSAPRVLLRLLRNAMAKS